MKRQQKIFFKISIKTVLFVFFQKLQVTWFRNTVVLNNSDKHDSLLRETIASLFQLLTISSQIYFKGKFS